ncbi:MAG: hypothetical protein HKP01_06665 [Gemmatimonadetes bacterium]|nr:hypothetical protein [Gemmatimonadota bacterium]
MNEFREWLRFAHMGFGFVGLMAFWIPVVTRKGSIGHVRFGTVFLWCVYGIAASAFIATSHEMYLAIRSGGGPATDPSGFGFAIFLFYIALITLASGRHGYRVVETKNDPTEINTTAHRLLAIASMAGSVITIAYALLFWSGLSIIFLALGPIGIGIGSSMLRYMRDPAVSKMAWWYEHMGAMLGAGVAFHTAFVVFGAQRLFDYAGSLGALAWLPWVLPASVGIPASIIWTRYYRRKFGDLPASAPRPQVRHRGTP